MGYQIGNVCYATKVEAENAYYSMVIPIVSVTSGQTVNRPYPYTGSVTIGGGAKLIAPEYKNGQWFLLSSKLELSVPECSPLQNFKDGVQIGILFMVTALVLWSSMYIKDILNKFS